jgi:twitching motility protein PilT
MRRLDFYVQHMLRQSAQAIVMLSGEPVEFRFTNGKVRRSNQPISHKQVIQLVREVAPPDASDQLRTKGRAKFQTAGSDGNPIYVYVDGSSAEHWRVKIGLADFDASSTDAPEEQPASDEWDAMPQEPENANGFGLRGAEAPEGELESTFADSQGKAAAAGMPAPPRARAAPPPAPDPARPKPPGRPELPRQPQAQAPRITRNTHGGQPSMGPPAGPGQAPAIIHAPPPPPPQVATRPQRPVNPQAEAKLQKFLRGMLQARASDLHLSSGTEPLVRVDGEMRTLENGHPALRPDELWDMMMAACPPDVRTIFEDTNDADYAYELETYGRFRMNYFVDRKGPGMVARVIPFEVVTPEHLGIPSSVVDLCWLSKGLVLVTGPTGSGKSTTLASLIDFINRNRADHIITIEDPIEYVHGNKRCLVNQRQVGLHTASFAQALRAALREDPDIVVVGEMRDLETISIAIETAETGHLVFGTLHTTTAASTVDRIIDQFPAEEQGHIRAMLSESLRGVISQVLVKKAQGGRVGAYETLLVNSAAANLIREGKTFQLRSVMQTGRHLGMQTMNDHLFELVKTRVVEVKEAYIKAHDKAMFREMLQKARIPIDPALLRGEE